MAAAGVDRGLRLAIKQADSVVDLREPRTAEWEPIAEQASAWRVGKYMIMPDHIHLFATLAGSEIPFENWMTYWKSQFTKNYRKSTSGWQSRQWDGRIRNRKNYEAKGEYMRLNPVRHGLVQTPEEWSFQGELHELSW